MSGIPGHVIDQVHDRVDIVEVIGNYIPLKKAGRNYRAHCPFHQEKTPSFMVSQDKQIFHCFGCGAGGNVFNFVMQYERLEFPEAVRMLAHRAGVVIPSPKSQTREESTLINKLYAANENAVAFFQKNLREDPQGRAAYDYLLKRGLTEDTIKTFQIGFAVDRWDSLITFARQKLIPPDVLAQAGLAIAKGEGGHFDRFRNRIMFPIIDLKSRILGFGGRAFGAQEQEGPKYMNSPETQIYNKGSTLYGLHATWQAVRDQNRVVVVEGYVDLLIPYQAGIKNIVASLGTSLTETQVRLLRRYTKNVVVGFDPDKAGELATLRSLGLLLEEDLGVGVVRLPEGYDPDSFVRAHGAADFSDRVRAAKNLFEYKMSVLLSQYDKSVLEDKARIVEEMLPTIAKVRNEVLKSGYLKQMADTLGVDEEAVRQELKRVSSKKGPPPPAVDTAAARSDAAGRRFKESEKVLAGLLIYDNRYIAVVKEQLTAEEFQDPIIRKIIEVLFRHGDASKEITPGKLINYIEDSDAQRCIPELVDSVEPVVDRQKTLEDCIYRIQRENLEDRRNRIQVEIVLAQSKDDDQRINLLIVEYQKLMRSIKIHEEKTRQEA